VRKFVTCKVSNCWKQAIVAENGFDKQIQIASDQLFITAYIHV